MKTKDFKTFEEAFQYCRDCNKPMRLKVRGSMRKFFPSGLCEKINPIKYYNLKLTDNQVVQLKKALNLGENLINADDMLKNDTLKLFKSANLTIESIRKQIVKQDRSK